MCFGVAPQRLRGLASAAAAAGPARPRVRALVARAAAPVAHQRPAAAAERSRRFGLWLRLRLRFRRRRPLLRRLVEARLPVGDGRGALLVERPPPRRVVRLGFFLRATSPSTYGRST